MKASFVPAFWIVVALATAVVTPLEAADLDEGPYGGAPYDEPGYGEEDYGGAEPPPARYGEAPDQVEPDRPGSIKDGYPVPVPEPRAADRTYGGVERYDRRPPRHYAPRYACLEAWQIRRKLRHEGWRQIRPEGGHDGIVHIRARRFDSSSVFRLRVERCSGEILAAKPYYLRSFADGDRRPWQYSEPPL